MQVMKWRWLQCPLEVGDVQLQECPLEAKLLWAQRWHPGPVDNSGMLRVMA